MAYKVKEASESGIDSDIDDISRLRPGPREGSRRAKRATPVIPDMRFEQSYLLSIRPFLHPRPTSSTTSASRPQQTTDEASLEAPSGGESLVASADRDEVFHWGREVDVEWRTLVWVTARDQLFSPLAQGFLWGIVGISYSALTLSARSVLFPPKGTTAKAVDVKVKQAKKEVESVGGVVGEWWERLTGHVRQLAV